MANTVEELDFRLVIKDEEFNQKIKEVKAAAEQLNRDLSDILDIKNKVTKIGKDEVASNRLNNQILKDNAKTQGVIARETEKTAQANRKLRATTDSNIAKTEAVDREKIAQATIKTATAQERLNQLVKRGEEPLRRQSKLWQQMKNLSTAYFSVMGASRLVSALVRTTAEFELQRTTLGAILQDVEKANVLYEQMKELAVKSPFNFKELATYAKQLSAYSIPVNELYDTTKMLADVSAGLGVGMDRLVLAYGQIRSASFLRGQEVRQLTEAGIPILEELRKQFVELGEESITVGDVFDKISKRLVPFEMVSKVFKDMTSEGGKFYQMQEVQAETLRGKLSNLKDAYQIMFSEIGEKQDGILKGGVDFLRSLADNYAKVGRVIVELVSIYGGYRASLALVNLIERATIQAHLGHTTTAKGLAAVIDMLTEKSKAYAVVQKLISKLGNPWVLLGTAVAGLAVHFISAAVEANKFRKELEGIAQTKFTEAEKSVKTFRELADQLKNSTEGSQSYRDAISQLNRQYGDYLPNLLNEKNALQEILKVENEVTNAIYARARAYASEEGGKKIIDKYSTAETSAAKSLRNILSRFWLPNGTLIGEKGAEDFIKGFKEKIQLDGKDPFELFNEEAEKYFGRRFLATSFNREVETYVNTIRDIKKAYAEFDSELDLVYGSQGYDSNIERQIVEPIEKGYKKALDNLRNQKLPIEEFNDRAKALELGKLYQLKMAFEDLDAEAERSGKKGSWANKIKEIQEQIDALKPQDLGWLQKLVNPLVTGKGNNDLKAQIEDGYDEYVDKLRKEYKAVTEAYADSDKTYNKLTADKKKGVLEDEKILQKATEQNELYKQRKKVIEDISKALGISLETSTRKGDGAKSQEQKDIETKIDLLKKLQSAYEKLSEYVTDEEMPDLLSKFFSSSKVEDKDKIIQSLDFRKQLIKAAADLEKYDKDAAEKLRSYVGYDKSTEKVDEFIAKAKKQKEALKAQKALTDYLKSWNVGDETEGSGSTFKITKIVSDYQKSLDALGDKRDEATEKLNDWIKAEEEAGRVVDENTKKEKENAIATTYQTAATNLLNKATEDVRKTADDYLKEWADANNIDISNWSHKTIYELNQIQRALNGFDASNLPKEIVDALKKAGIDIEKFKEAIKKAADENSEHAGTLANEKKWDYVLQSASALAGLFEQIGEYAEAAGNSSLLAFANGFASSFRTMGDIAEKVAKQDYIGAIISGVTSVATAFLNAAKNAAELERNIRKGKLSAEQLKLQLALDKDTDSIFGENKLKSISNAWNEASKKFTVAAGDIAKAKEKLSGGSDNDSNGWGAAGGVAAGAALGFALGTFVPVIGNAIGAGLGALIGAAVGLITGGLTDIALETDNFQKSLEEMAKELDAPLINEETGLFNVDTLQLILDTYDQLDQSSKEVIEAMIAHTQEYETALEQLTDGMKDIFGQLADDIASKFIEAFKQSGEAALDYADIIDDVAVSLAQMVLKSMLIERVFKDDLAGDIAKKVASGQMDEALAMVDGAMQEAQALAPAFQEFLEGIQQYFNMDNVGESLGDGIKGITEDTANLLASYLNAIRADVSYGKVQRDNILAEIKNLAISFNVPTLNDYLNQIQANTFDTAQSNREILSEIRSMMGLGGEGSALRVITT